MSEPPQPPQPPQPPESSLRERALQSGRWVALGRLVCELAAFAALIALARLLTPADVGHAAVAMIVFTVAIGLLAGSFGTPLIREPVLRPAQAEVATLLSLVSGVLLTGLCALVALALEPVIGRTSSHMVLLASPAFLLASASAVPQALRSRRLAFKALMLIEMATTVLASGAAVLLAALGLGPAAMVLGSLAGSLLAVVLAVPGSHAPLPRWHRHEVRELLRFGAPASASALFNTAVRNVDYAILSGRLAAAQVGLYYRAFTLAVDYQNKISNIVVRVLFPVLSRTDSPERFRSARSRVIRLHSLVLFPLLGMLLVTAPDVIPLLYGSQWDGMIVPTQILVGAGFTGAVGTGIGPVMMAAGRPRALLVNNVISFFAFAAVVYVCAGHGLVVTCVGVVAFRVVALVVSQYCLATRLLGIPLRDTLVVDPGPAAVCTAALVAVALAVSALTAAIPVVLSVALTALAGLGVYAVVLRSAFPGSWGDVRLVVEGMVPARLRRAAAARLRPQVGEGG
jgi:lipopolysaccharide exporter